MREDQEVPCSRRPAQSDQPRPLTPRPDLGPESFSIHRGHSRATVFLICDNAAQGILSSFFFRYADYLFDWALAEGLGKFAETRPEGVHAGWKRPSGATNLFKMLLKYRSDDKVAKKARLLKRAQAESEGKTVEAKKPIVVKYGSDHAAYLIEQNKPQLVVISHDVDPSELVVGLPTLCRKMEVPYCIVKGKAHIRSLLKEMGPQVIEGEKETELAHRETDASAEQGNQGGDARLWVCRWRAEAGGTTGTSKLGRRGGEEAQGGNVVAGRASRQAGGGVE